MQEIERQIAAAQSVGATHIAVSIEQIRTWQARCRAEADRDSAADLMVSMPRSPSPYASFHEATVLPDALADIAAAMPVRSGELVNRPVVQSFNDGAMRITLDVRPPVATERRLRKALVIAAAALVEHIQRGDAGEMQAMGGFMAADTGA